jgi:hypothetical protein
MSMQNILPAKISEQNKTVRKDEEIDKERGKIRGGMNGNPGW